jgi:hypothetical protein
MTLFEEDRAPEIGTLDDESGSDGIYDERILADDETLVGNIHSPCNLEMTSVLNQMKW